jgi:hypothetical protein
MRIRRLLPVLVVLVAACDARPPINTHVRLDLTPNDRVRVIATAPNDDELAGRFAVADPEEERIVIDKKRGAVQHVEHSGTIERFALQRFFADVPVTIKFDRGYGWSDLAIYPGASMRATRPQRERTAAMLQAFSQDAARYVESLSALYRYLDIYPQRAEIVFHLLTGDATDEVSSIAEEEALIEKARDDMNRLRKRVERRQGDGAAIAAEVDLVYNPFPHDISVRVPHEIVSSENFERRGDDVLVIPRPSVFDAVSMVSGKFIAPDPLAMILRGEETNYMEMARTPRRIVPVVTAADIAHAFEEKITPPSVYRVRWPE